MHHSKAVGLTETKSAASRRASRRTTFGSQPLWNGQRSFRHARSYFPLLAHSRLPAPSHDVAALQTAFAAGLAPLFLFFRKG